MSQIYDMYPEDVNVLVQARRATDDAASERRRALRRCDAAARGFLLGGALLTDDDQCSRLEEFVTQESGMPPCPCDDTDLREESAYLFGLAVGLRLARAIAGEADARRGEDLGGGR